MKITLENTSKIVQLNSLPARLWEGSTESGVKVVCFITRIMVDPSNAGVGAIQQFEKELQEQKAPSVEVEAIPLRMLI